jgi:squalene-associated FAD-dependent desaturase
MSRTIHIIGAGLSGLAAAVRLAPTGNRIVIHEATAQAGGRCRSYHDHSLGMMIDNGNHLLLSGNSAAMDFLDTVGARDRLIGPATAAFPFVDLKSGERWVLDIGSGRLPWWIFDRHRRVPGTRALDYLALGRLLFGTPDKTVADLIACKGMLYDRLVQPLLLAALNIEPRDGSAALAATIIRETLGRGGKACRPLIARDGLAPALVDPALAFLRERGVDVCFGHELRAIEFAQDRASLLRFGDDAVSLGAGDVAILAVPAWSASTLIPGLSVPTEFRAIVNAHFRYTPPKGTAPITGLIHATSDWLFAFEDRFSVTVSSGDRLINAPREALAREIWGEICRVMAIADPLPSWQIVRERRATFAATPEQEKRRPGPRTAWQNLFLAGDWTATGLPATIEGSIRSGNRAAQLVGEAG